VVDALPFALALSALGLAAAIATIPVTLRDGYGRRRRRHDFDSRQPDP